MTPRWAVLFKTHFWDDFVARQFSRLLARAAGADVFVLVDETHGHVPGIAHDRVIRMTEEQSRAEGYLQYPAGRMFWYSTDYQLYHFVDRHPEYDTIVTCEYDCTVTIDLVTIVSAMMRRELGFVGEPIKAPPHLWHWAALARPFYPEGLEIIGRLVCFAAFSRPFALQLKHARLAHTRLVLEREAAGQELDRAASWPNNEAFVGAELARTGQPAATLAEFADTSRFDWAPAWFEPELAGTPGAIAHPVLAGRRFIQSLLHFKTEPSRDLFDPAASLHQRMARLPAELWAPMFLQHFLEQADGASVDALRAWLGQEALFNIARGKPATQSSVSVWSRGRSVAQDASAAVAGQRNGGYGFHTAHELRPWWCVDLQVVAPVREIRIYNRPDVPWRAATLAAAVSSDLLTWHAVYEHEGDAPAGEPFSVVFDPPLPFRFLRLALRAAECFHLDQIEVYV